MHNSASPGPKGGDNDSAGPASEVDVRMADLLEDKHRTRNIRDKLRAEGFLPAEQASPELVGKRVTFVSTVGQQSMQATGKLRFVSPEMDPVTRQVRVWAALDNPDATRVGRL